MSVIQHRKLYWIAPYEAPKTGRSVKIDDMPAWRGTCGHMRFHPCFSSVASLDRTASMTRDENQRPSSDAKQSAPLCWVVSDGRAGIENQALGLAEAVARKTPLRIEIKRIELGAPWKWLPAGLIPDPFSKVISDEGALSPPYPDLWIATGRASVPLSMAAKKRHPKCFVVQTQNPRAPLNAFDLVIPPHHDQLTGNNVFPILGAPNRVTPERIKEKEALAAQLFSDLPTPRVAVLLGGENSVYGFSRDVIENISQSLVKLCEQGCGLMISTSRRTPPALRNEIAEALKTFPHFLWDAQDNSSEQENPYFAMLGAADYFLVTADSINMATDAAHLGRPIYSIPMRKKPSVRALFGVLSKYERFQRELHGREIARLFDGSLASWTFQPLTETERAAAEIIKRWRNIRPL